MKALGIFNDLSEHIHLRMKACNRHAHDRDWIESKAHVDYDMWFIESGIVQIEMGRRLHTAMAGDIVFFYPDMPYTATTGEDGCRFIYVHFDLGIGHQVRILNDFELAGIVPRGLMDEEALAFRTTFGAYESCADRPGIRFYLKGCLSIVIARLIDIHSAGDYRGAFALDLPHRKPANSLAALHPVVQFIHAHSHRPVKIGELAGLAGMSEKYFITYFKKALGITPNQYIIQVKMNKARDYLYQDKYTVQEIAGLVGYSDPFTFSKAFKKYFNVPPSQFI